MRDVSRSQLDLLNDENLVKLWPRLRTNSSAMVGVGEHWASRLAAAVRGSGGEVISLPADPRETVVATIAKHWKRSRSDARRRMGRPGLVFQSCARTAVVGRHGDGQPRCVEQDGCTKDQQAAEQQWLRPNSSCRTTGRPALPVAEPALSGDGQVQEP